MEIKVVIPSHKRAKNVKSKHVVSHAVLCVPERQGEEYRKANPDIEVVTHPDSVIGLPPKRQWICDTFGDVFMLDDDVSVFMRQYTQPATKIKPDVAYDIIQATADVARQMGLYLFAFENVTQPLFLQACKPFRLQGFVNGFALGLLKGSKVRFVHPLLKLTAEEDFLASCLNAYYHRAAFIDTRYAFHQRGTYENIGGLADYRTVESTASDVEQLRRLFGSVIIEKRDRRIKTKHAHAIEMQLPY